MKEAAHELGIAPRTVRWHLAAARERLNAATLLEVVVLVAGAVAPAAIAAPAAFDSMTGDPPSVTLPPMISAGSVLRVRRLRAGLSQAELARRLGFARQRVTALEGAAHVPPASAARYLGALHDA